ncbi:protein kinase [uncultured Endozoicomonas sp.]|uniref:protein kinase domain-containing protein n=1 Tax=uncultured Endozoicomonas sp. TaxID=432652 RepID=UPI0026103BD1|nr:protein kinase [uncultured Endozoicomonas sp.]
MQRDLNVTSGNSTTNIPKKEVEPDSSDQVAGEDDQSVKSNPTFSGRSITLREYIEESCQTYHPVLSECQKEKKLQPLFNYSVTSASARPRINPMSSEDVKIFDSRLATNEELARYREYLKENHSVFINGVEYSVENLSEKTPLLYQFFSKSSESKITDEYVEIFRNNCRIETGRRIIIFTDSFHINEYDRRVFEGLAQEFDHVKLFDASQLPDETSIDDVKVVIDRASDGRPEIEIISGSDDFFPQYFRQHWEYMDCARNLALLLCDQIFEEAFGEKSQGCIYMDWDFILKREIGEVNLVGGIGCYIQDEFASQLDGTVEHQLGIDNCLIAVSQGQHPAIKRIFTNSSSTPFRSFVYAVNNFFSERNEDDQKKITVDVRIEVVPEDFISRKYLNPLEKRFGKIKDGELIQWKGLQYNPSTIWRQMIAFPVSESMVSDVSRFLDISTWQSQNTGGRVAQSSTKKATSESGGSSGISNDSSVNTLEVTRPKKILVASSQQSTSNAFKSEGQKNSDIITVRSQKGQKLWRNAFQIIKAKNTLRLERIDEEDPDPIITDKSPSPDQEGSILTGPPRFSRISHQFSLHPHEVAGTGNWTKDNPVIAARSISRNVYHVAKPLGAFGENELAILIALQQDMHENIANYLGTETGKSGKEYVILQQGGEPLGDLIRRGGMSLELIDNYIWQLVNVVGYLNSRDVVHRDLNPNNILCQDGQIKLCDFGLSSQDENDAPANAPLSYAPIEAYLGINHATYDMWTIGCLLYESVTGRRLFPTEIMRPVARAALSARNSNTQFILDDSNPYYRTLMGVIENAQQEINRRAGSNAADFFSQVMAVDYRERLTVQQAAQHPYIETAESSSFQFGGVERPLSTTSSPEATIAAGCVFEGSASPIHYTEVRTEELPQQSTVNRATVNSDVLYNNPDDLVLRVNSYQNISGTNTQVSDNDGIIEIPIVPGRSYNNPDYMLLQTDEYQNIDEAIAQTIGEGGVPSVHATSEVSFENLEYLSQQTSAQVAAEEGVSGVSQISGRSYGNPENLLEASAGRNVAERNVLYAAKEEKSGISEESKVKKQKVRIRRQRSSRTKSSVALNSNNRLRTIPEGRALKNFNQNGRNIQFAEISTLQHMRWLPEQNKFARKLKAITRTERDAIATSLQEILTLGGERVRHTSADEGIPDSVRREVDILIKEADRNLKSKMRQESLSQRCQVKREKSIATSARTHKKTVASTVQAGSSSRAESSTNKKVSRTKSRVRNSALRVPEVKVTLYFSETRARNGKIMGYRYYAQFDDNEIEEIDRSTFNLLNRQRESQQPQQTKRVTFAPELEVFEAPAASEEESGEVNTTERNTQQTLIPQPATTSNRVTVERRVPPKKRGFFKTLFSVLKDMWSSLDEVKVTHRINYLEFMEGWGDEADYWFQRSNASGDPMEARNAEDAADEAEYEAEKAAELASCLSGTSSYTGGLSLSGLFGSGGTSSYSSNHAASSSYVPSSASSGSDAPPSYSRLSSMSETPPPSYSAWSSISGDPPSHYSPSEASSSTVGPASYCSSYDSGNFTDSTYVGSGSTGWSDASSFVYAPGDGSANNTTCCDNYSDHNMDSGYSSRSR